MVKQFENGLFIFRRDLRVIDNNGLNLLNDTCERIYAIFIFTPEQVGNKNPYKSDNSVQFMIESLKDLSSQISKMGGQLYTFYGDNERIITDCIEAFNIQLVCYNLDYTPYARERDDSIVQLCERKKVFVIYDYDYYLNEPNTIINSTGKPYQKFTPYYNAALKHKVANPIGIKKINFSKGNSQISNKISLDDAFKKFTEKNEHILVHGGREEALKTLRNAVKTQTNYKQNHDNLEKHTTLLSAAIKFGCVSIREVFYALKGKKELIRQLYWRDFYGQILYHFPRVLGHSMKPNYEKIKWNYNSSWFEKWCKGQTGFPIVDAGMREMNQTGYMHNRARLIVASFLVKTLLISWEKGEKYFATKLTDYDPANNNGNWQWIASTGVDSQPYFRIFNPWEQAKKVDPNCGYIKKWIPELTDVPNKDIFNWETEYEKYKDIKYPKPMVDYKEQKDMALKMYSL